MKRNIFYWKNIVKKKVNGHKKVYVNDYLILLESIMSKRPKSKINLRKCLSE